MLPLQGGSLSCGFLLWQATGESVGYSTLCFVADLNWPAFLLAIYMGKRALWGTTQHSISLPWTAAYAPVCCSLQLRDPKVAAQYTPGQQLEWTEIIKEGEKVDVAGTTIGKGFQGECSNSSSSRAGSTSHSSSSCM